MNLVILQGRPTRDPEINRSQAGKVYCKFRIAVDRPYKGKNVPRKADYFDVLYFDKKAQYVFNNLAKGALITVMGRLEQSEYIDNTGRKIDKNSIMGRDITIHEWLRKNRPITDLDADFDNDLIVPREITKSLFKQIEVDDEDIPDDLLGRSPFDD